MTIYTPLRRFPSRWIGWPSWAIGRPGRNDARRDQEGPVLSRRLAAPLAHQSSGSNTVFEADARGNGNYYNQRLAERDPGTIPSGRSASTSCLDSPRNRGWSAPDGGAIIRMCGDLRRHTWGSLARIPRAPSSPSRRTSCPPLVDGEVVVIAPRRFSRRSSGASNTAPGCTTAAPELWRKRSCCTAWTTARHRRP
jgi:hypothetical protein